MAGPMCVLEDLVLFWPDTQRKAESIEVRARTKPGRHGSRQDRCYRIY